MTTPQLWDVAARSWCSITSRRTAGTSTRWRSTSGNFLLTASNDNTVKVWDLREGQLFYTLNGHEGAALCASFRHTEITSPAEARIRA